MSSSLRSFRILGGFPTKQEYVRFIKNRSVDGHLLSDLELTAEWRRANAVVHELESSEPDVATIEELIPLPDDLARLAESELQNPAVQRTLGFLPYGWSLVELDKLIVWQKYVDLSYANQLCENSPRKPSAAELVRIAAGSSRPAPLHVTTLNGNNFMFSSASNDLRVLGTVPLDPTNVKGYEPYGYAGAVIGVFVGYSINLMMAVQVGNRLMLVNGTHRAYALRAHGITHAPMVVRRTTSKEDVEMLALPLDCQHIEAYLNAARPPMLRDFFDDRLAKSFLSMSQTHLVQLEMKFVESRATAP